MDNDNYSRVCTCKVVKYYCSVVLSLYMQILIAYTTVDRHRKHLAMTFLLSKPKWKVVIMSMCLAVVEALIRLLISVAISAPHR